MSLPIYRPNEVYYLKCNEKVFTFRRETLEKYGESNISNILMAKGPGPENMTGLDYDDNVMYWIVMEMKNMESVNWQNLSYQDLCLAARYTIDLQLFSLTDQIKTALNFRCKIGNLSTNLLEKWLKKIKDVPELFNAEEFTLLSNLTYNLAMFFKKSSISNPFDDPQTDNPVEPKESKLDSPTDDLYLKKSDTREKKMT